MSNEKFYPHKFQNAGSTHAWSHIQDVIAGGIDSVGSDVVFIPMDDYTSADIDHIFGELKTRNYSKGYGMRMMTNESVNIQGTYNLSKFGFLDVALENTFYITVKEFFQRISGVVNVTETEAIDGNQPTGYDETIALTYYPSIGDLIWYPLHNKLFEITLVDNKENSFWQKYSMWKINAKLYKPNSLVDTLDITGSENDGLEIGSLDISEAVTKVKDMPKVENLTPTLIDPTQTGNATPDAPDKPLNKNINIESVDIKNPNKVEDIFGNF